MNKAGLLVERAHLLIQGVDLDVVECAVEDHLLACVFQLQLRSDQGGSGGADVVRLREGVSQGLRGNVVDGGLADRKSIGIAKAGADREAGLVSVDAFHDAGFSVGDVGGAYAYLGAVGQGKGDYGVERDSLGPRAAWHKQNRDAQQHELAGASHQYPQLTMRIGTPSEIGVPLVVPRATTVCSLRPLRICTEVRLIAPTCTASRCNVSRVTT